MENYLQLYHSHPINQVEYAWRGGMKRSLLSLTTQQDEGGDMNISMRSGKRLHQSQQSAMNNKSYRAQPSYAGGRPV